MSQSYLEIQLDKQPIELCKLLKIADLVTGGGEAKVAISEGYVLLNGEVEYQKRKKVYHEDIVEFNGETLQVVINESLNDALIDNPLDNSNEETPSILMDVETSSISPTLNQKKNKDIKKAVPTNEDTAKKNKRKPISF
jgi:ribosome-associated protein